MKLHPSQADELQAMAVACAERAAAYRLAGDSPTAYHWRQAAERCNSASIWIRDAFRLEREAQDGQP